MSTNRAIHYVIVEVLMTFEEASDVIKLLCKLIAEISDKKKLDEMPVFPHSLHAQGELCDACSSMSKKSHFQEIELDIKQLLVKNVKNSQDPYNVSKKTVCFLRIMFRSG